MSQPPPPPAPTPILLTPSPVALESADFAEISAWPYDDPFVGRLLREDIPQRVQYHDGSIWSYRDPGGTLVGFGTLDVSVEYHDFAGGRPHPYIPLLAIRPKIKSLGYGTSILRHLIDEAALLVSHQRWCSDVLFLDVYERSLRAIGLYEANGFAKLSDEPIPDPDEGGERYFVMAKRVGVAPR